MAKNLLIVESPAKAKTIEKILGEDFEVRVAMVISGTWRRAIWGSTSKTITNPVYCSRKIRKKLSKS
jgi:DNA topoisomerase IA